MKLILMMAMTADGIIAKNKTQNVDWTSKADKQAFVAETKKHRVIIMGNATFQVIGKPLPDRLNLILTSEPERYKDQEVPGLLEFKKGEPSEIVKLLEQKGFKSAVLGGGAKTNADFLKAGLVDEILLTIEPKLFGQGITLTEGVDFDLNLELLEAKEIGDNTVQLKYKVLK